MDDLGLEAVKSREIGEVRGEVSVVVRDEQSNRTIAGDGADQSSSCRASALFDLVWMNRVNSNFFTQ